jgi:hypothetical protein
MTTLAHSALLVPATARERRPLSVQQVREQVQKQAGEQARYRRSRHKEQACEINANPAAVGHPSTNQRRKARSLLRSYRQTNSLNT